MICYYFLLFPIRPFWGLLALLKPTSVYVGLFDFTLEVANKPDRKYAVTSKERVKGTIQALSGLHDRGSTQRKAMENQ